MSSDNDDLRLQKKRKSSEVRLGRKRSSSMEIDLDSLRVTFKFFLIQIFI